MDFIRKSKLFAIELCYTIKNRERLEACNKGVRLENKREYLTMKFLFARTRMRAVFYYGRVIKQHWRNNKAIIEAPSHSTVGIISLRANLYIYFPLSTASHNAI